MYPNGSPPERASLGRGPVERDETEVAELTAVACEVEVAVDEVESVDSPEPVRLMVSGVSSTRLLVWG